MRRLTLSSAALVAVLGLAACESAEEKAEGYYQSALALLEEGDPDRAMVEFRNVFKYDGFHKEARQAYADLQLERGEIGEAYGQYLRLIEQYPETADVRRTLASLAIESGDWEEAERHGTAAIELEPDLPETQAIAAALAYRDAVLGEDTDARGDAAAQAATVLAAQPDNQIARRIVIDAQATGDNPEAALEEIERALAQEPNSLEFHVLKYRLLAQMGDTEAVGLQLQTMFDLFPDNEEVRSQLITWYLGQQDFDGAEALLRRLAGEDDADPAGHVTVVRFLQAARGPEAAAAELDRLTEANAANANADLYRAMRGALDFEGGEQDAAIAEMEAILEDAEASEQTRNIKSILARMLVQTGNNVGARALVEEVLAEDPAHVDALKMRAAWLIEEDKPGEAITDLRAALGQAPRDADVMTLMAQAHERDGATELAGERLALAVEVSGNRAAESLRYARFLQQEDRTEAAETVITDALRVAPADLELLGFAADLALGAQDWGRASELLAQIKGLSDPRAEAAARNLETAILLGQNQISEGIAFLEEQAEGSGDTRTIATIVLTHLRNDDQAAARDYLDAALAEDPDNAELRLLDGSLAIMAGEIERAEEVFRTVMSEEPENEAPVRLLYNLLTSQGDTEGANAVLAGGVEAQPGSVVLRLMQAGALEQAGDIEGAIAIYEGLYAENSSNVLVANNLASLITTHRDSAEDLDRAFAIARRLRGAEVPAFQDTYGWIEYRRGNYEEALADLEPAAEGLPEDPLVQYHLGMTYAALERTEEAKAALTRALELAGDSDLAQYARARETLESLGAE